MNKPLVAFGLAITITGICLMIYSAYPLYQANYTTQYSSLGERCNATDPYLHPELGAASWMLLFSGFPFCIGFVIAVMGFCVDSSSFADEKKEIK